MRKLSADSIGNSLGNWYQRSFLGSVIDGNSIELALNDSRGFRLLSMPEFIDVKLDSPRNSDMWNQTYRNGNGIFYTSSSIKVVGKTNQGSEVVAFAHIPNYLSDPKNFSAAVKFSRESGKYRDGSVPIPEEEFERLLKKDGDGVVVFDYNKLKESRSDNITLETAINHPAVIPFFGSEERAKKYLKAMSEYGNSIGIWHAEHTSDHPTARFLSIVNNPVGGLHLDSQMLTAMGNFIGLPEKSGYLWTDKYLPNPKKIKEASREFVASSLFDQYVGVLGNNPLTQSFVLEKAEQFVAPAAFELFAEKIKSFY